MQSGHPEVYVLVMPPMRATRSSRSSHSGQLQQRPLHHAVSYRQMQQHDTRMPDATGDPRGQKYPLYHAMEDDTALFSRVADVRQQTGSWSFARWGMHGLLRITVTLQDELVEGLSRVAVSPS